jgi:RNA polymerase sigma-70 factor (ECF subfamily)
MVVSATNDSFPEFFARLKAGDSSAPREMFQRFTHQLVALARKRFGPPIVYKVDPEDIVQSTWKSFFSRYGDGNLELDGWNSLWGLLTLITLRKCDERNAYHRAACRDPAREVPPPASDEVGHWLDALSREPTPDEAALLSETVEQLLADLDEDERPIVELSLQGHTTQEISERLDYPERTVRRLRERVRHRLERGQQTGS